MSTGKWRERRWRLFSTDPKGKGEDGFVTHHEGKNFYAGLTTRKSSGLIRIGDSEEI